MATLVGLISIFVGFESGARETISDATNAKVCGMLCAKGISISDFTPDIQRASGGCIFGTDLGTYGGFYPFKQVLDLAGSNNGSSTLPHGLREHLCIASNNLAFYERLDKIRGGSSEVLNVQNYPISWGDLRLGGSADVLNMDISTQLVASCNVLSACDDNQSGSNYSKKSGGGSNNLVFVSFDKIINDTQERRKRGGVVFVVGLICGCFVLALMWYSSGGGWRW